MLKIFRLFKFWLFFLLLAVVGILIKVGAENSQLVSLSFLNQQTPKVPLYLLLMSSFVLGVFLTITLLSPIFFRQWRSKAKKEHK